MIKFTLPIFSILLAFTSTALSSPYDGLTPFQGRVIDKISVIRKNVFDDQMTGDPPFYYRWGNALHIVTKENVIRRELLFDIGDLLDLQKIIETERNLRGAGFIGEIEISAVPDSNNGIELLITTTDLWTTKPEIYADAAGGNYTSGLSITEANMLGHGKYIEILGQIGNDQDGYAAYYIDNRLFGTRLSLDFSHVNFTYSRGFSVALRRPQYSLTVPFGARLSFANLYERPRLFSNGEEIFRYRKDTQIIGASAVYTIGRNRRLNIMGGYDLQKTNYATDHASDPHNDIIPSDETISYPSIGAGLARIKYDVVRFVDAGGNPEDLSMGVSLKYLFGRSDEAFGADYIANYQTASAKLLLRPYDWLFIGGSDDIIWWERSGRAERIRHRNELAVYCKPAAMHLLTIHALTDFAWRQKPTYQAVLGGGNGLRGYSYFEFAGDKLALGNIEYRLYTPLTLFTVRIGAAAFFDIGNVWERNQNIDLGEMQSGAGVGLRFGLTKSSTARVVSLDIARALSKNEFFIGFGTASAFNLKNFNIND
jgi:hypothetical protein